MIEDQYPERREELPTTPDKRRDTLANYDHQHDEDSHDTQ